MKTTLLLTFIILVLGCTTGFETIDHYVPDYRDDSNVKLSHFDFENDMFLLHEGTPNGVPTKYNWQSRPVVIYGFKLKSDWNAITAWGQLYAEKSVPNPDKTFPKVRVHLKDLQLYLYFKDGTWKLIQNTVSPAGYLYTEDFIGDIHKNADDVKEPDGGISVRAGSGYNFHFWGPRARIDDAGRENIAGLLVVCKARLMGSHFYTQPSKYILSIGADYWRTVSAQWNGDGVNNDGAGLGRFKYVTPEWQYFHMHTFTKEEVKKITFPQGL